MTEPRIANSEHESQEPEGFFDRLYQWLFYPKKKRFLIPAAGVWILAMDWLLFSTNALSAFAATPIIMIIGFVFGGAGAYLIQNKWANDAPWKVVLKALLAGIVVGLPWPLGGTIVGGWILLYSGLRDG